MQHLWQYCLHFARVLLFVAVSWHDISWYSASIYIRLKCEVVCDLLQNVVIIIIITIVICRTCRLCLWFYSPHITRTKALKYTVCRLDHNWHNTTATEIFWASLLFSSSQVCACITFWSDRATSPQHLRSLLKGFVSVTAYMPILSCSESSSSKPGNEFRRNLVCLIIIFVARISFFPTLSVYRNFIRRNKARVHKFSALLRVNRTSLNTHREAGRIVQNTVGYARTNVIGSRTSFVIASVLAYIEIYVFRGNPFQAYSLRRSTIQHNHLNRKNIIENKKNVSVKIT